MGAKADAEASAARATAARSMVDLSQGQNLSYSWNSSKCNLPLERDQQKINVINHPAGSLCMVYEAGPSETPPLAPKSDQFAPSLTLEKEEQTAGRFQAGELRNRKCVCWLGGCMLWQARALGEPEPDQARASRSPMMMFITIRLESKLGERIRKE